MTQYNSNVYTNNGNEISFAKYLEKVFMTMGLGLFMSAIVAIGSLFLISRGLLSSSTSLLLCLAEIGIAIYFSAGLSKMSRNTAWICYIAYCVLTGLSLSSVLYYYSYASIAFAFISTAVLFVCMSIIGHTTHIDLTKFSSLFMSALVSLLIVGILNALLFKSSTVNYFMAFAGVIIFLAIIAYDMQRLRYYYQQGSYDAEFGEKMMIMGAFQLYLDFINLFLRILQIFGRGRDRR